MYSRTRGKIQIIITLIFAAATTLVAANSFAAQTYKGEVLTALAAGSDHSSTAIDSSDALNGSFQVEWSGLLGTIDATLKVQVSNDNGATWDDISGASLTLSGASGHETISVNGVLTENKVKVVYAHNSVTGGSVSCFAVLKQ